jgi:hypothetical protein
MQPAATAADNYDAMPSLRRLLLLVALPLLPLLALALGGCQDDSGLSGAAAQRDATPPFGDAAFATAYATALQKYETPPLLWPEFLTPVAQAEEQGVKPYWLGEAFEAGGLEWRKSAVAHLREPATDPGLDLEYSADPGVILMVASYSRQSAEAERLADEMANEKGVSKLDREVDGHRGELFEVPGGRTRPANGLVVFVYLEDGWVVATAFAGSSGISGDDANPLLDKDLLIATLAEHLRPYPD